MKIIAKVSESRVIVEMTSDELAKVMGYSNDYRAKDKLGTGWLSVGTEHATDERFELLQALAALPTRATDLDNSVKALVKRTNQVLELVKSSEFSSIKER